MKYGQLIFALSSLALSACVAQNQFGTYDSSSGQIFSTFKKESSSIDVSVKEYMTIGADRVKKTVLCRSAETRVFVDVVVPAVVSDSHIEIKSAAAKSVKYAGGVICSVKIDKGVMAYEIADDGLTLTPAGGESTFYGYKMGKRPTRLERLTKTAEDLIAAADDAWVQRRKMYDEGTDKTFATIGNATKSIGQSMVKNPPQVMY